ncbi:hypothetical protein ACJMK2_002260, partial [Sinanodonta woodiana]
LSFVLMDPNNSKSTDLEEVSSQPTERRVRTLSVKGMEMYETTRDEYCQIRESLEEC